MLKRLLPCLIFTLGLMTVKGQLPNSTNNQDVDRLNVRIAFGPPVIDTMLTPYKLGELRTRPQDGLWYRYNGKPFGQRRWDYIYFGPNPSVNPSLDDVLTRGNSSSLGMTVGPSTFTSVKVPSIATAGQVKMVVINPDGSFSSQTIPGGTGSVINTINGLTAAAQFLKTSFNVATSPAFVSATATHTLNLPIASFSAGDTGIVTPAMVNTWNNKTNLPGSGDATKYLRGDTTWQTFPTIPAAGNFTQAGGGITITGSWPNLTFTVSGSGGITTLSGDVTTPGGNSGVSTIANNVVTYAKMQQASANKLLGNPTGSTANITEIALNTGSGIKFNANQLTVDTTIVATIYKDGLKLLKTDTGSMLSVYLRKLDTASLSNRINLKPGGSGSTNAIAYWSNTTTLGSAPLTFSGGTLNHTVGSQFNSSGGGAVSPIAVVIGSSDIVGITSVGTSTQPYYRLIDANSQNDQAYSMRLYNSSPNNITGNQAAVGLELWSNQFGSDAYIQYNNQVGSNKFLSGITSRVTNNKTMYTIAYGANQSFFNATVLSTMDSVGNYILYGTSYTKLSSGLTTQRPSTVIAGMIRYNPDSNAYEYANNSLVWRIMGTGSGGSGVGCSGCLVASNNLSDVLSIASARTNLGLGSIALLNSINNSNWSGAMLSATNGGTGVNGGTAANGRLLIGNGSGYTLANLINSTPTVFTISNGAGSIALGIDTNAMVTKAYLLSNPSTISILRGGAGINTIYSSGGGTQIVTKGLNGSTLIGITQSNDSSLVFNSLATYNFSVVNSGTDIKLLNDNATPGNDALYATSSSGVKGWRLFPAMPVATNTANGLFSSGYKKRVDSGIVIMNAPLNIASLGYDSIVTASFTLDTLYHKVFNVQGTTNRTTVSKAGSSVFVNAYTFDIDANYAGQSSIITLGTVATGVWHGTPISTTYGGMLTGGNSGYILSKASSADYDYAWIPAPTGGGGSGVVANIGAGYRLVANGSSGSIKTLFAGSGLAMDSTTNSNGITFSIPSFVSAVAGTANQITVSASTGSVTFSIPSQLTITNLTTSGTNIFTGTTYQAPNGKLDMLVFDTTSGRMYKQAYYYVDTTGYAAGSTYLTFNGTKVIMSTTSSSAVTANTIYGNSTGSTASPTFFNPSLTSSLFANEGNATTILHGNAAGNPTWSAVVLSTDVTGTLSAANGGTGQATYTIGDVLYASGTTAISKLTGNTTTTKQLFMSQGTGSAAQAPSWYTPANTDVNNWAGFTVENVANKSTSTSLGTSNTLYPTQNAVKTYVDNAAYLPIAGGSLTGTAGAGFVGFLVQSGTPSTPAGGIRLYSTANNQLSFVTNGGVVVNLQAGSSSGIYIFPSLSGASDGVVTLSAPQGLVNKTLTSPQINFATNAVGDIYYRNSGGSSARLPIGSTGQVMTVSGGLPVWSTPSTPTSGTYTPTLTVISTATGTSAGTCTYTQTGSIVTVYGYFNATVASIDDGSAIVIELTLPVASNILAGDLNGTLTAAQGVGANPSTAGTVGGDGTTHQARLVSFVSSHTTTPIHYFSFQYIVK